MLDYKDIIIKHYALGLSGREIASILGVSKSGVNDFLKAFENCSKLTYPLSDGITNFAIADLVYGPVKRIIERNFTYELPDYEEILFLKFSRKNMTLVFLWGKYKNRCLVEGKKFYSYRQFCEQYQKWCSENAATAHFNTVIAEKTEVDFAGKTFDLTDCLTGEICPIVVFVSVLPYSQYIYAEGMLSTKEPQWIDANNHMLTWFGGVTPLIVCDNCKQAVITNHDWIEPELNKDYAEWAEHNHTVILPAKVRRPRYKSSVENAVGILEKGIFHDLEEHRFFSLEDFNQLLWKKLTELNRYNFSGKSYSRYDKFLEEKQKLMPLPSTQYQYRERKTAKVSSDFHVRFDNAYYSVPKQFLHKQVLIRATSSVVKIYSQSGSLLQEWPRAKSRGQWLTNPDHLPKTYKQYSEWNGPYSIQKAMTVGQDTVTVIEKVLKSKPYEVQTYRQCIGILNFAKKYGKATLESCCHHALQLNRANYTFIKNTITAEAGPIKETIKRKLNDQKNKGAYVMDAKASSLEHLLAKSKVLVDVCRKEEKDD